MTHSLDLDSIKGSEAHHLATVVHNIVALAKVVVASAAVTEILAAPAAVRRQRLAYLYSGQDQLTSYGCTLRCAQRDDGS